MVGCDAEQSQQESTTAEVSMNGTQFASSAELDASRPPHWVNHVRRHSRHVPDGVALRFAGRSTTWRDLDQQVGSLAAYFVANGVVPGDRVLALMHNGTAIVETVLAANAVGAIGVPVNFRLAPDELAYIAADCAPRVVVCDAAMLPAARAIDAPGSLRLVAGAPAAPPFESFDAIIDGHGRSPVPVPTSMDDTALIIYTSGTTGRPKGAELSHQNLQSSGLAVMRAWELTDRSAVALCPTPLFHIGAIGMLVPLIATASTTVIGPTTAFSPADTLELLETERCSIAFMVPTQWQAICDDPSVATRDISLRIMTWGAAPATLGLLEQMVATFPAAKLITTFGQTEMAPISCILLGDDARRKIGSIGRPADTVEVRVVDAEMNDVEQGEVGEIVYRGANLMRGYWRNPDATAQAFTGGWFHSGDLVRADEDGFLYVVDRLKDMIISGGENIYCAEVEDALAGHPLVKDVAVVGRPHPAWGETPVAVVVPADPAEPPTLDALLRWSQGRLASYKKPTGLMLVDELPRTTTGKVRKDVLRPRVAQLPGA
jgi:fatty-acyl-CoA synthase